MVARVGLEPTRACAHKILSLASLPISSPSHLNTFEANICTDKGSIQEIFQFSPLNIVSVVKTTMYMVA